MSTYNLEELHNLLRCYFVTVRADPEKARLQRKQIGDDLSKLILEDYRLPHSAESISDWLLCQVDRIAGIESESYYAGMVRPLMVLVLELLENAEDGGKPWQR